MKKRFLKPLVAAAIALAMLALLAACGEGAGTTGEETEPPHIHEYETRVVEPTVDTRGYIEQACECGEVLSTEYFGIAERDENPLVLFIGNSYTQYNTLHQIFRNVVSGQGISISTYAITKGGHTLLEFADPSDADGKKIDSYLDGKDPDYIFLQEQSERPAKSPALFYDGVRQMAERLSGEDAEIILYQTWGRKEPHSTLTSNGWTHEEMAYRLAASYEAIAEEMGYALSPAGSAFLDVYLNHPEIDLFDADHTHPSPTGSYLVALCHYATLYGFSPIGVEYTMDLPTETADVLQRAAHNAVFGESIVPEEYRTSSVGVNSDALMAKGNLSSPPTSDVISVGITGDKGVVSSSAVSQTSLSDSKKADLADIAYGVSIIGVKDMYRKLSVACDGVWSGGNSYRLSFHFDGGKYLIDGSQSGDGKYSALLTYNFGGQVRMDAVGYLSGSMGGFAQTQDIYVSDDGVNWRKIDSACYDAVTLGELGGELKNLGKVLTDSKGNAAAAFTLFDMGGVSAKYLRVGIITGVTANDWDTNTYELIVYGSK